MSDQISQRERFEEWLTKRRKPYDLVAQQALLEIADAFDASAEFDSLSPEQLQIVVAGASDKRAWVWDPSSMLLGKLSARWPAAAQAIVSMMDSKQSHVRFAAICSLRNDSPENTKDAVLRKGIVDKSDRVRWKAAQEADSLDQRQLIPSIEESLRSERKPKVKRSIELSLRMLRDGYWIRPDADGRTMVTARVHRGISSEWFDDTELRSRGIDAIVHEMRDEHLKLLGSD